MIIYNVTVKIDCAIESNWLLWMKQVHIPEILKTKCFTKAVLLRIIEVDETDGPTFAIQYHASDLELYHSYVQNFAPTLRKKAQERWGDKFVAFRTVLQSVN